MRGGAIPLVGWGTGLLALLAINGIWARDWIQVAMFGFAVLVIYGTAFGLWLAHRGALRKGPPPLPADPEAVPHTSLAALALGVCTAAMLFGSVFGKAIVFFGAGLWVLAAGRLVIEVRAQRRSLRRSRGIPER